jgi:replicative DNA helicase
MRFQLRGIKEFGKLNVDLCPGQVLLIGSRSAVGRRMFMLLMYYHVWKSNFIPQVFVSNEEDETQVLNKLISTVSYIELNKMSEKLSDLTVQSNVAITAYVMFSL